MIRSKLSALALASLLTLPLAAAGCSKGQSPTEPALLDDETSSVSASSVTSVTGESKGRGRGGKGGGNDDGSADDNNRRRGRGRGGRGNDDRGNDDRGNRPRGGQEFEGAVSLVGGDSVTLAGGTRVVVNGGTHWSGRGDLFSLSQIQGSLSAGNNPRVEGRGTRQSDGSIVAQTIKAEHTGD